jgi:hypothetical protein
MELQQYALVENGQIVFTENFKRPELVPQTGDWRIIGEVTPEFDASTQRLGDKTLTILNDESVAYVWSIVELPPPSVPAEIQMWQARSILARAGLLEQVNQAVKAAANPEIEIAWEYAPNVVRASSFVSAMAASLGLSEAQLDGLFIEGSKIK